VYLWNEPCLKKRRKRKGAVVCLSIFSGAGAAMLVMKVWQYSENAEYNRLG
jgi:hypothetical protein